MMMMTRRTIIYRSYRNPSTKTGIFLTWHSDQQFLRLLKREDCKNCSVLYWVHQSCTVLILTHIAYEQFLQLTFCTIGHFGCVVCFCCVRLRFFGTKPRD